MKTQIGKTSAFGARYNMYRLPGAGYAYNPDLKEWEVFELDEDGSIQDLSDRCHSKAEAHDYAERLSKGTTSKTPT